MYQLLQYSYHNHTVAQYFRSYVFISIAVLIAATVLYFAERRFQFLSRFYNEERTAVDLAVFRIALMSRYILFPLDEGLHLSGLNRRLMDPPIGWGAIAPHIPFGVASYHVISVIFLGVSLLSLIGLWTRVAVPVSIALASYLFTIPQMFGKVNHYHDLLLMGAILALSPCADALSVDAWRRKLKGVSTPAFGYSRRYGFPLAVVMTFIGLDYFFPGLWKVAHNGLRWFSAQNLHDLIAAGSLQRNAQTGFQIWVLNSRPVLLFGAFMTIVFEVGWIFAVMDRRTRAIAFLVGLAFHNFTKAAMGIGFDHLQFCYTALVSWDTVGSVFLRLRGSPIRQRIQAVRVSLPDFTRSIRATGLIIASLMVVTGMAGLMNSWPIACYPRFDTTAPSMQEMTSLLYLYPDGTEGTADVSYDQQMIQYFPGARWSGLVGSLGCSGWGYNPHRVLAFAQFWQQRKNLPAFHSVQLVCHGFYLNSPQHRYLNGKSYVPIEPKLQVFAR